MNESEKFYASVNKVNKIIGVIAFLFFLAVAGVGVFVALMLYMAH